MKKLLISFISLPLVLCSVSALAEKVIVEGTPVAIENRAGTYVPVTEVVTPRDYYYFRTDNSNRVCYRTAQPGLANVSLGVFPVRLGNDVVKLHCYDCNPDYFTVR